MPLPPTASRRVAGAVLLLLALLGAEARAQTENAFGRVEPGLGDAAYIGILLPLNIGLVLNPTPASTRQSPPGFDQTIRSSLRWNDYRLARSLSDALLYTSMLTALSLPVLGEWNVRASTMSGTLVAFEALLMTSVVTDVVKLLTSRQRPNEYYSSDPTEPEHDLFHIQGIEYSHQSFFSGHTSIAFAAATMVTIFAWEYEWLDPDWRWTIPVAAYSAATLTGYFRMAGDRHWLSDVVVGAFVGTGVTYLVFSVRTD
jgi:membrane-associated phospholipid phosphatase